MDWLPDPVLDDSGLHYKPFSDVFRKMQTTDVSRPSNSNVVDKVSEDEQVSIFK